jgi:Domain of unknown function (DUF5658)
MKYPAIKNSRLACAAADADASVVQFRQTVNSLMILLFAVLHIADGVVTYLGLSFTGVNEANPILNYIVPHYGLGPAIAMVKVYVLLVLTLVYFDRNAIKSRWGTAALAWADTFYGWVVANNFILVMDV